MARPRKTGLDYFPFDVDFFEDKKIKLIKAEFGSDGIVAYQYLLCQIYRNGFYIEWHGEDNILLADIMGCSPAKTRLMVSTFVKRSLFDDTLFYGGNVLTSGGIQRRYLNACKERIRKAVANGTHIPLFKRGLCLLNFQDFENLNIQGLDYYTLFDDNSGKNPICSGKNPICSGNYPQSKVKKSKVKKSSSNTAAAGINKDEELKHVYQQCQNLLSGDLPMIQHVLQPYAEYGMETDLILKAVEKSAKSTARNWNYACKILDEWMKNGICTIESQKEEERRWKEQYWRSGKKETSDIYIPKDELEELSRKGDRYENTADETEHREF